MKRVVNAGQYEAYPEFITIKETRRVTRRYKQKYLHVGDSGTHKRMLGMYYEVFEENGKPIDPWDVSPIDAEIDVYPDGFVGYVWNGRLNKIGTLSGSEVIKDM